MATSHEKLFDKLNNSNYRDWSFRMKMLLISKDLWKCVEPKADEKDPVKKGSNSTTKDEKDTVDEENQEGLKALSHIVLMIDSEQLIHVEDAKDGKEAWKILSEYHLNKSTGRRFRLYRKLFGTNLEVGGSMKEHLNAMFMTIRELKQINVKIEEDLAVSAILSSLNNEYENLIVAMEAWDEKQLTLANVKLKLMDEWERRAENRKSQRKAMKMGDVIEINSSNGQALKVSNSFECHYCKKKGHIRRNCYEYIKLLNKDKVNESAKMARFNDWYSNCFSSGNFRWFLDSGATSHMTNDSSIFNEFDNEYCGDITIANGNKITCIGRGKVIIRLVVHNDEHLITLNDVLLVPSIDSNLISVSKLCEKGFAVTFDSLGCYLDKDGERLLIADKSDNLFVVKTKAERVNLTKANNESCIHEWHLKLAHRNLQDIKAMKRLGLKIKDCNCSDICESCIVGKISRSPFPQVAVPTNGVLDCIVSDICGPMPVTSLGGARYFATFIDVHSKYSAVYFLKTKDEVESKVIEHLELLSNKFRKNVKSFRTDRGTEYMSNKVQSYLRSKGISYQCTVAYSPQQNGIAERKNRTLVESCRAMLSESGMPKEYWAEAVMNANYTFNRIMSKRMKKTPYEIFFKTKPRFNDFKEFGCSAYVMIPQQKRNKLDDKAEKLAFIGYDQSSKGFRLADVERRKVVISRDLVFLNEKFMKQYNDVIPVDTNNNDDFVCFPFISQDEQQQRQPVRDYDDTFYDAVDYNEMPNESIEEPDEVNLNHSNNSQIQEEIGDIQEEIGDIQDESGDIQEEMNAEDVPTRRSTRSNAGQLPERLNDYITYICKDNFEPKTYAQAMNCPDADKWKQAMSEEIKSISENKTWTLTELPKNKKAIGCKWVYKLKFDDEGNICRYKARLVAQGFSQKYGEDYDEVFAPVARTTTFRILMSIAGINSYHVKHFDIKTAFLYGEIEEEIYMKQPPEYTSNNLVCKLNKSLYGLKQAARAWNKVFHEALSDFGFKQNDIDKCLYSCIANDRVCYLIIHVDDLLVVSNDLTLISKLQNHLTERFELKDLGNAKHFLGIDINKDDDGNYHLSQSQYIDKIVAEAGLMDGKYSKYPLMTGYFKHIDNEVLKSNNEYRKLIGMLLYVSNNTRPDIAASVAILSKKVSCPTKTDLNEAKRVIRYLNGTKMLKLKLSDKNNQDSLHIYTDASWAEDPSDRKSTSGYCCKLNGGTISWCSRKQDIVALSSTESEYIALTEGCKELQWTRMISKAFKEINIPDRITVYTDSQSSIKLITNQKFSNRSKHIDTKYHYVKQLVDNGDIELKYCQTDVNVADMMTKPLGSQKIEQLRRMAGVNMYKAN